MSVVMQSRDKKREWCSRGCSAWTALGGVLRVEVVVTALTLEKKNVVPLTPSSKVWLLLYGLSRKSQMVNNVVWRSFVSNCM